MPPTSDELWGLHLMPPTLAVEILMPNGIIIELQSHREATIESIKADAWVEAKNHVLYRKLNEPSSYVFVAVTQDAKVEEFYDESCRLCDLRLFQPLLKLIEPRGNKDEKMLNFDMGIVIGKPITELESKKDGEVMDFRRALLNFCKQVVEERESLTMEQKAYYAFPPEVDLHYTSNKEADVYANITPCLSVEDTSSIQICVWSVSRKSGNKQSCTLKVSQTERPGVIIREALAKHVRMDGNDKVQLDSIPDWAATFVLKVCGMNQYLLSNQPIFKYKSIRQCISHGKCPQLMLVQKEQMYKLIPKAEFLVPSFFRRLPSQPSREKYGQNVNYGSQSMSIWKLETNFKVKILGASYVNVRDVDKIYVRLGLFHGTEALCPPVETEQVIPSNPKWDSWAELEFYLPDTPRSARLCLSICSVTYRKKRSEHCALAWGNLPVFDYKGTLLSERIGIHLWPVPKGHDELLNPLGVTGSNFNSDSPCLQIEFDRYSSPVIFPPISQIEEYSQFVLKLEDKGRNPGYRDFQESRLKKKEMSETDREQLLEIIKRDPLSELLVQEKDFLWSVREHCLQYPDSLPKLLDSVRWNSRDDVCVLYMLLRKWPPVSVGTALELLDCKYADLTVRKCAVNWLHLSLSDDLLYEYLLQLVQVVKHELYLDNELSQFLIRRALMNRKIGHYFFWHLKAEMHDPIFSLRCGMLLEAYCRGIGSETLKSTKRQVEALEKLTKLTDTLKERREETQKERLRFLCNQVQQADYLDALQSFASPLNYDITLGELLVEQCRIMDSAKRPLWLVWTSPDPFLDVESNTSAIIFKNGDDLRQDMLTLQVIRVIDLIWKSEDLDLKMLPYSCLSTGKHVGMIEVVMKANTVMNIQRIGGRMAAFQVDSTQLHKWIKDRNTDNYDRAVDTFTKSCAGYCVATFVLGIGDRNPDNIMINEQGQIFHIDFGHFLGHFKKKFGINRERVPFVLTDDFLYVISKGAENPKKSKEFEAFTRLCATAYLCLRKHANLLITLFTMMLTTGIPELQSIGDITYLRNTLQVEKSEAEALQYFHQQFFEAHGGAWTTKIDWFFHSVKHM